MSTARVSGAQGPTRVRVVAGRTLVTMVARLMRLAGNEREYLVSSGAWVLTIRDGAMR